MRISNWEDAKKQAVTKFPAFTAPAAVIFFVISFIIFWNGPIIYQEQTKQVDWPIIDATISYVYEYYDRNPGSKHGHTKYDIHYDYYVEDKIYSGIYEERALPMEIGSTLKIKYNPQIPEEHTLTLNPSKEYLVTGPIFGALGVIMLLITVFCIKKRKKEM